MDTSERSVFTVLLKARYCPSHDWTGQGRAALPHAKYCRVCWSFRGRCAQLGGFEKLKERYSKVNWKNKIHLQISICNFFHRLPH